ncbi:hypothetical protein N9Q03_00630 [Flavobacteriaceae bacterium]|jgi:hypothetical protein|nr:hypothetical protein [Flavobacteriaceae bacterium]
MNESLLNNRISKDTYLIIKYIVFFINSKINDLDYISDIIKPKIVSNKNIYLTTINEGEYSHKEILIDIDELSSVTDKIKLFIKNTSTEGGKHNYILDYENNSIVLKKYSQEETISIKNLDKLSCLLSLIIKRSRKLNN